MLLSVIMYAVSLDFVEVWSASSKQSWIETQTCSVLGRQPASTVITYSDHVGIRASFQFLPTVPAPVSHVTAASDPSKHHKILSSKILLGQQQAWQRASKHGAIACTLAVGAFACQSGIFRSARKLMAAAAVFEAALAAHALW